MVFPRTTNLGFGPERDMEQPSPSKETHCETEQASCPAPVPLASEATAEQTSVAQSSPAKTLTPAEHLDALRLTLEASKSEMLRLEPLKNSIADLEQRIDSLEKAVAAQPDASASYIKFYRAAAQYASELECSIHTVQGQLELSGKEHECVSKAIATVDAHIKKAQSDRTTQDDVLKASQKKQLKLEKNLAQAKRWYAFFTGGLEARINAQRDELKDLGQLADPAKDQCEVSFYLSEMKAMLTSARSAEDSAGAGCYDENINIATFVACWQPKCYTAAYEHWMVAVNEADSAQKLGMIELEAASTRADELAALADKAVAERRVAILNELKAQQCCNPMSK